MKLVVTDEILEQFKLIAIENLSEPEWAKIESDDMFQSKNIRGGFDATEMAFCFSYFDERSIEFWFQLTLDELNEIVNRGSGEIEVRLAPAHG